MEMKKEEMLAALDRAVSETFEQMAFMEVCPVTGDAEATITPASEVAGRLEDCTCIDAGTAATPEIRWVRIHVGHPLEVELWMGCPVGVLAEVSETVFCGMEFPEGVDVQGDTLAELANMIAGALVSHLFPDDSEVVVGLPKMVAEFSIPDANAHAASDTGIIQMRLYAFDDGRHMSIYIR